MLDHLRHTQNQTANMMSLQSQPDGLQQSRIQAIAEPSSARVVSKPVPASQADDPRRYQLEQVRRRFSPQETIASDKSTSLVFKLTPSDPDFPFELAYLDCDLRVPQNYPEDRPTLSVRNKNIPRGFSINVERGWERLANERKKSTLLSLVNALDKNLEQFLSEQKVDTVKLMAFEGVKDTRHIDNTPASPEPIGSPVQNAAPPKPARAPVFQEPTYTKEQVALAKERRAREVRAVEARMGRMSGFRRSADGVVFTLPIEPKRREELPPGVKAVRTIHLIVPVLYPLQDVRLHLVEAEPDDAEPLEELFSQKAVELKDRFNLMALVNYLSCNLFKLVKEAQVAARKAEAEAAKAKAKMSETEASVPKAEANRSSAPAVVRPGDKSHIQYIERPPEWSLARTESDEDSSGLDEDDEGGAALEEDVADATAILLEDTPERGTMMSFPGVELHGVEILQVSLLSLSVKCERCKTINELKNLKPGQDKADVCKKCNNPMAAKYRQTLVHEHSTRAGFIDLAGCKVVDMLPSTFVPTCSKCSTPGLELVSVRGESMTNVCRDCHGRFTFKIPEIKFHFITPGSLPPPDLAPRRKQERLGLHAGEPLPARGACSHYRKSYRWFRFSCCSKIHPCDKCHDNTEDHMNEWANRMICGWCSREQNYNPEACNFCGRSVIGKKGRGFWEGGKGTRDQRLMSRKDPRKYKRIGG